MKRRGPQDAHFWAFPPGSINGSWKAKGSTQSQHLPPAPLLESLRSPRARPEPHASRAHDFVTDNQLHERVAEPAAIGRYRSISSWCVKPRYQSRSTARGSRLIGMPCRAGAAVVLMAAIMARLAGGRWKLAWPLTTCPGICLRLVTRSNRCRRLMPGRFAKATRRLQRRPRDRGGCPAAVHPLSASEDLDVRGYP